MPADTIMLSIAAETVALRRRLHASPERGWAEFKTSAAVAEFLEAHGYTVRKVAGTGLIADLVGGAPTPVGQKRRKLGFRADLDALPVIERTGLDFSSANEGVMHACGHDVHAATIAGLAASLAHLAPTLKGDVRFIFQPAEEGSAAVSTEAIDLFKVSLPPRRGAVEMIAAGALDGVDACVGVHCWPDLPAGSVGVDPKIAMAGNAAFRVRVRGKGGHGATPHQTVDPVPVAASLILALQTIASRKVNPAIPFVLTIGTLHAGTVANVIPDFVEMQATLRCCEPGYLDEKVWPMMETMVKGTVMAAGAEADMAYVSGLPPVVNDRKMVDRFAESARKVLGESNVVILEDLAMTSEDFAYFAQQVPSVYVKVGVAGPAGSVPLHSPLFSPDELCLPTAIDSLVGFTQDFLLGK